MILMNIKSVLMVFKTIQKYKTFIIKKLFIKRFTRKNNQEKALKILKTSNKRPENNIKAFQIILISIAQILILITIQYPNT